MDCPICHGNSITILESFDRYFQCKTCRFCFQQPLPSKVYEGPKEGGKGPDTGHLMSDEDKRINRLLANKLYQRFVPTSVLDIGAKYPYLMSIIKDRTDVMAIDAIPIVEEYGKQLEVPTLCADFEESTLIMNKKYDLITLVHTMEHFYDPAGTMAKAVLLLSDSGVIFVRVPNIDQKGIERDFTDHHLTIHPYIYSTKSVEILANLIGCEIFDFDGGYGQSDFYLRKITGKIYQPGTLSVCMIVKNEADNIIHALNSVNNIADEIIVIDTGSSDNTVEVASKFPKVKIGHFPWIDDFSAARNVSINKATSEWIMWLDADDVVDNPEEVLNTIAHAENKIYNYTIQSGYEEWKTVRLFKNNHNIHFSGRIHECLDFKHPLGDSKVHITHHIHKVHSEDRCERNLRILRKEEQSPRTLFYLGQTLRSLAQYDEAVGVYSRYLYMSKFNEERYIAQKDIGRIYMYQKMYQAAIKEFEKCAEIDNRWREHDYYIGECYFFMKEYVACVNHMYNAINKPEPQTTMWKEQKIYLDAPHRYLFASYEMLKEYENALKHCLIVRSMLPEDQWIANKCEHFKAKISLINNSKIIECYRWGSLGDVLMTTAALRGLKEKFPDHKIRYITHPNNNTLLSGNKYIDEIDSKSHNDTNKKYHFCYPEKEGYPKTKLNRHLIKIFNECADLPKNSMVLECTLTEDEEAIGIGLKERYGKYVTMHIKSGWSVYKDWKFDRWIEIAGFLTESGYTVIQIGGKGEQPIPGVIDLFGMPIKYSVSAIKHSEFHIGVDSFSNHVTWAVGKQSLILFGSTSPTGSGYDQNVNVYLGMKCQPCYRENKEISKAHGGPCPFDGECMERITVDYIKQLIKERFLCKS